MSSRSIYCVAILLSFLASTSRADDRTQEAYQRLHEREAAREAARAAAATQPANITNAQLEALQKRIKELEKQVTQLQIENSNLRSEAGKKAADEAQAARQAEAAKRQQDENRPWSAKVKKGMTIQEVTQAIGLDPRHILTNGDGEQTIVWMAGPEASPLKEIRVTFKQGKVVDFIADE